MRFLLFYCCVRRFNSWMWVRRGGGVDDGARIGSLFAFRFSIWIGLDWIGLDWIGLDWIGLDQIGWLVGARS